MYAPDPATPDPSDPLRPYCRCGLPAHHRRHAPTDTTEAQAEHLRRYDADADPEEESCPEEES